MFVLSKWLDRTALFRPFVHVRLSLPVFSELKWRVFELKVKVQVSNPLSCINICSRKLKLVSNDQIFLFSVLFYLKLRVGSLSRVKGAFQPIRIILSKYENVILLGKEAFSSDISSPLVSVILKILWFFFIFKRSFVYCLFFEYFKFY